MNKIEISFMETGVQVKTNATMTEEFKGAMALIKTIAEKMSKDPIEVGEILINGLRYEKARKSGISHDEAWKLYGDER